MDTAREGETNRQTDKQMNERMYRWAGGQIDRLTDEQTDTHIYGKTDLQLDKLANCQPDRWTGKGMSDATAHVALRNTN
jgi:hypothetical protein